MRTYHSPLVIILTTLILPSCSNVNNLASSLRDLAQKPEKIQPIETKVTAEGFLDHVIGIKEAVFKNTSNVTVVYDGPSETYRVILKPNATGPFVREKNGDFTITNPKTGVKYNAGQFETYTAKSFEKEPLATAKKKGTFHGVETAWSLGACLKQQYDAAIKGEKATFLAASNYDGIEEVSGTDDPTIASNLHDATQGPAVSLGALPGMLLRFYSQVRENKRVSTNYFDPQKPRVHMLKMSNLETQNGYVYFSYPMQGTDIPLTQENFTTLLKSMGYSCGIMYHKNISVTASDAIVSGYAFENFTVPEPHPASTIDQIFAAGLSLGGYRNGLIAHFLGKTEETWVNTFADLLAQKIIDDIFALSIQAAAKNGANVLYLLPIGCGVFGNKHVWLGRAIEKAKSLIIESGLTVKFIFGPNYYPNETLQEYNEFIATLKELAKDTGGSYTAL